MTYRALPINNKAVSK